MKTKIIGITGAIITLVGAFFKTMHWPGTGPMLIIGMALLIVYLFSWFANSYKGITNSKEKAAQIVLFVVLLLASIGATFKIFHWPYGGEMVIVHYALLALVFIPVYLIYLSSEQDENTKNARLSFFVFYLAIMGVLLVKGNSNAFLNALALPDQYIGAMTENMTKRSAAIYEKATTDSLAGDKIKQVKKNADEMAQYITKLKGEIFQHINASGDAPVTLSQINGKDNYDIPTFLLIGDDEKNPKSGEYTAVELKGKIIAYREVLLNMFDGEMKKNTDGYIGLKTDNTTEDGISRPWEIYTFYRVPIVSVVITLDQLQNEVRYAELVAVTQLLTDK